MSAFFKFVFDSLKLSSLCLIVLTASLLSGCASEPIFNSYFHPDYKRYQSPRHAHYRHKRNSKRLYRVKGKAHRPGRIVSSGRKETSIASWYGAESGSTTAMGTRFHPEGISAAHKTLPLPSKVRVTNLQNGCSIVVVVNDRGPYKNGRIIDLSHGAAKKIGMDGLAKVEVEYLGRAN
jgi:rare lipoprotein A